MPLVCLLQSPTTQNDDDNEAVVNNWQDDDEEEEEEEALLSSEKATTLFLSADHERERGGASDRKKNLVNSFAVCSPGKGRQGQGREASRERESVDVVGGPFPQFVSPRKRSSHDGSPDGTIAHFFLGGGRKKMCVSMFFWLPSVGVSVTNFC